MGEMVKFASQVDGELLGKVRALAKAEGRHLQALIDEALNDLVAKKAKERPRPEVMRAYYSTLGPLDQVYKHLAK